MGVTNSNKTISPNQIACDGSLLVTLSLTAAPDIITDPTDIVLTLDRSSSMQGDPLANLKLGAKTFIDIIADATGGTASGQIGYGSRIGIVSFASAAAVDTQLITDVSTLKTAVDTLAAGGNTNHADAFTRADALFDPTSTNTKVIVMFTDGKTTVGAPPAPVAEAAKAQGVIIYCIGLVGTDGVDVDALNQWATAPADAHVAVTPDAADLEELFAELARNLSKPGATNIVIEDTVTDDFVITDISTPSKGTSVSTGERSLRWSISQLGIDASETAQLQFTVRHTGQTSGFKPVDLSITYSDAEGNVVSFPSPSASIDCSAPPGPCPCPDPVEFTVSQCDNLVHEDVGDIYLDQQGQIVQLSATLKHVCPGKRVALAVVLTELAQDGTEYPRGMQTMTVPAHTGTACQDVPVSCIPFVVPGDASLSGITSGCGQRRFQARFLAHYMDTDLLCPQPGTSWF